MTKLIVRFTYSNVASVEMGRSGGQLHITQHDHTVILIPCQTSADFPPGECAFFENVRSGDYLLIPVFQLERGLEPYHLQRQ